MKHTKWCIRHLVHRMLHTIWCIPPKFCKNKMEKCYTDCAGDVMLVTIKRWLWSHLFVNEIFPCKPLWISDVSSKLVINIFSPTSIYLAENCLETKNWTKSFRKWVKASGPRQISSLSMPFHAKLFNFK